MLEVMDKPEHGSVDEERYARFKAERGSKLLLTRLREFHGEIEDEPPAQLPALRKLPPPKKPWFQIVDAGEQRILISDIVAACAAHYGVTICDILSARRTAKVVRPRQVSYYLAKVLTLKSLPEIGRRIGQRDHTSCLSGIRKIERLRQTNTCLEMDLRAIAASVGGSLA